MSAALADDGLLKIKFPTAPSDSIYKSHGNYQRQVLDLVLGKTGRNYTIIPVSVPVLPTTRVVRYLDAKLFNVVVFHTDPQKESELIPIRVPIYRGLSGWRLLFVHRDEQQNFETITTLDQLRSLNAGQGNGWPDIKVLQAAGLNVITAPHRENLMKMLSHGRIDYFPRGVFEIWNEAPIAEANEIIIEENLVIHYPTAFYMFVNKGDTELAQRLTKGFEMALNDGSFLALFYKTFAERIHKVGFKRRKIIAISNPTLTPETPLTDTRLWFSPKEL